MINNFDHATLLLSGTIFLYNQSMIRNGHRNIILISRPIVMPPSTFFAFSLVYFELFKYSNLYNALLNSLSVLYQIKRLSKFTTFRLGYSIHMKFLAIQNFTLMWLNSSTFLHYSMQPT